MTSDSFVSLIIKNGNILVTHIIDFIHVEDGLGSVTDDEDEDNAGEQGGHGGVPPVAAGPGHHAAVVSSGAGDCSEDQPVEDGEDQHWQQAHH